jgi:hypothetical protein
VVYLPWFLLMRLGVCSAFDSLMHFFSIWAIPDDMPLPFSMEEAILYSLSLFLVYVLVSALAVSFPLTWLLGSVLC